MANPRLTFPFPTLLLALVFFLLQLSPAAGAGLSDRYADWAEGPAGLLMTKKEKKKWKKVETDAEAAEFIDLFWARRDPDLETPANEFRRAFEARVATAAASFSSEGRPAHETDRGRVFLLLGEPHAVQRRLGGDTVRRTGEGGTFADDSTADSSYILWEYDKDDLPVRIPANRLLVRFYEPEQGQETFVLDRSSRSSTLVSSALSRAPEAYLLHPELDEPPHAGEAEATLRLRWLDLEPPPWPDQARLRIEPAVPQEDQRAVWLQLELPAESPEIEHMVVRSRSEDGRETTVETPVTAVDLPEADGYQSALALSPGSYKLRIAAGTAEAPVAVRQVELELPEIPEDETWLSPVWVAAQVEQEPDALLGSPFNVGGWHLTPSRRVARSDQLGYFGYVRTPGVKSSPAISVQVTVKRDGRALGAPFSTPVQPSKVKGDLWMYGNSVDLSGLPPGEYDLDFRITAGEAANTTGRSVPLRVTE